MHAQDIYQYSMNNECSINLTLCAEIVISAIQVTRNLAAEEERFTVVSFPPRTCENRNNNFYNSILPQSIIASMTTAMIVGVGWIIFKVS